MSTQALTGLRVIDLSRVLGGPYCTQILADHGADVIKVEPPAGDETRTWGPPFRDGVAAYYEGVNRNKRGIVLDLAGEEGRGHLLRLLETADILVENFKTGTLEKWGLGYADTLEHKFPRLIHCRVSGFGSDGPLGGLPGYDAAIQAMTGLISVNGEPGTSGVRLGVPAVDLATGLYAVAGILMAVQERHRSGRGQFVDITLYDSAVALLHPQMANYLQSGMKPGPVGNAHPNITPYDTFATRTKPLFLAVGNDGQFRKLCEAIGVPALATDPRYASNANRTAHRPALKAALEDALRRHDADVLAETLIRAGVPCAAVRSVDAVASHPHTIHRNMVIEQDGYRGTGSPIKMSRSKAVLRSLPPKLGEHTAEVLAEK